MLVSYQNPPKMKITFRHSAGRLFVILLLLLTTAPQLHAQQQKKQEGKASYYSRRANGARTSSGVKLNNDSLVCAHRTHPFGTLLKVKNPANGKEVIVKVIDRGPHTRGRIIDLSYEAARQLGMLAAGVAMVEVSVYDDSTVPLMARSSTKNVVEYDLAEHEDKDTPWNGGKKKNEANRATVNKGLIADAAEKKDSTAKKDTLTRTSNAPAKRTVVKKGTSGKRKVAAKNKHNKKKRRR